MKLTSLIENSNKDYKERNPVAKELRHNPLYKAKTETDKKKEAKKGYQKHKGKIEEKETVDRKDIDNFHKSLDKLVHKSFGHSSDEKKMKEATIKPYVSMYTGDNGKMVYDVLDKDGKSVYKTNDKQEAFDFFKDQFKNLAYGVREEQDPGEYRTIRGVKYYIVKNKSGKSKAFSGPTPAAKKYAQSSGNWYDEDVNEADVSDLGPMNVKMKDVLSKVRDQDTDDQKADAERKEQERVAKAKELGDAGMQDYVQKLKSHDWTYDYSDDHRVWQKGSAERDELHRLADILDPDHKMWNKYDPFARKNEASGYEGQSEPTSHTFNGADVDTVSTAIKKAGISAYAEKTSDGVKVHTYDHDRQSVAKALGINETMSSEIDHVKSILDKYSIKSVDDIEYGSEVYDELFSYYMDSGEMPYGVMKARDGMPDQWIADRIHELGLLNEENDDQDVTSSDDSDDADELPAFLRKSKEKEMELSRIRKLAGLSTADTNEDYSKMTHELITKLIKQGMSDDEIQARTGEAGERIRIIRKNADTDLAVSTRATQEPKESSEVNEYDGPDETSDDHTFTDKQIKQAFGVLNDPRFKQGNYDGAVNVINKIAPGLADHPSVKNALMRANEATQDLVRAINPLKAIAKTNVSPQMTAKGIDAISQGERPSPQQIKAIEPYMSSVAKAIQNPQTATQMRNIIKKVN